MTCIEESTWVYSSQYILERSKVVDFRHDNFYAQNSSEDPFSNHDFPSLGDPSAKRGNGGYAAHHATP